MWHMQQKYSVAVFGACLYWNDGRVRHKYLLYVTEDPRTNGRSCLQDARQGARRPRATADINRPSKCLFRLWTPLPCSRKKAYTTGCKCASGSSGRSGAAILGEQHGKNCLDGCFGTIGSGLQEAALRRAVLNISELVDVWKSSAQEAMRRHSHGPQWECQLVDYRVRKKSEWRHADRAPASFRSARLTIWFSSHIPQGGSCRFFTTPFFQIFSHKTPARMRSPPSKQMLLSGVDHSCRRGRRVGKFRRRGLATVLFSIESTTCRRTSEAGESGSPADPSHSVSQRGHAKRLATSSASCANARCCRVLPSIQVRALRSRTATEAVPAPHEKSRVGFFEYIVIRRPAM